MASDNRKGAAAEKNLDGRAACRDGGVRYAPVLAESPVTP